VNTMYTTIHESVKECLYTRIKKGNGAVTKT
jgi:hypothetical protein